jgi:hypothetical protein
MLIASGPPALLIVVLMAVVLGLLLGIAALSNRSGPRR